MADEKPTLERRIADFHIHRHLRPYRRAKTCLLVVTLPADVSSLVWKDAALAWTGGDRWHYHDPVSVVSSDSGLDDVRAHRGRTVILIEREEMQLLEHPSVAAADVVLDIADIDPKLVKLAYRQVTGGNVSDADAATLASLPAARRRLVALSGRPVAKTVARIITAAEKDAAAKTAKAESSKVKKGTTLPLELLFGYGKAKEWGYELARDLADYRAGNIEWSDVDGGLLLSGPPGTGKTTYAKALAETCGVPLVSCSYAMWQSHGHQGDMLKAMRMTFDIARKQTPCIMLIDEIDGFVDRDRSNDSSGYMRGVVNGLLEELDGAKDRDGIVVIGACNNPDIVDVALRRPGRLDRHIELALPDAGARAHILRHYLGVDLDLSPYLRRTEGMSGAELEGAARAARRLARREGVELEDRHLVAALPARAPRPRESVRLAACHEVGHAVVGALLGAGRLLHVFVAKEYDPAASVSVAGAAVFRTDPHEHRTAAKHRDLICAKLAGMAAEEVFVGSHGEGCVADLEEATALATYMHATLGMGDTLSSAGLREPEALAQERVMNPALARDVEQVLQKEAARARQILEEHRDAVDELVELLILRGRLIGPEVRETIRSYEAGPTLSEAV